MAWVAVAGTAINAGSKVFSQIQANKAQQKSDNFLNQRRTDLAAKLNTSQNTNYLNSDAARASLELIRKNMAESRKATQNAAIQGGATPEAVIANEGKLNDKYQNAIGSLVAQGDQIKQRDKYLYEGMTPGIDNLYANSLANKVNQWGQFDQNMNSATSGIMNAWANGGFDKGKTSRSELLSKYKFTPGTSTGNNDLPG